MRKKTEYCLTKLVEEHQTMFTHEEAEKENKVSKLIQKEK